VDITSYLKAGGIAVKFNWSNDNQAYIAIAKIVRVSNPQEVIEKIKASRSWTKERIIEHQFKRKEEEDLIAGPETVSLRDPITRSKIKYPIKSQKCKHVQCFDGVTFMQMNQTRGRWECPVCNSKISFGDLIYDGYFDEILNGTNEDCENVQILEKGEWRIPETKKIVEATTRQDRSNKRDLIVLDESPASKKRMAF
jgi:E3 SUMO-protein ligase PIAS1